MNPKDYLKNGKVYIWKETFAIVKSNIPLVGSFAIIKDKNGITSIIDKTKINKKEILEINNDWKVITFDIILPLELIGFLALVAQALATENISIFVISSFSTDHILVKRKDLNKAIKNLNILAVL
mgnify:CR=1 FL=1